MKYFVENELLDRKLDIGHSMLYWTENEIMEKTNEIVDGK